MKTKIILLVCVFLLNQTLHAQIFIDKAVIEYEVKSNIQKTMGNGFFMSQLKDQLPQFKTGYYNFIFANNKSIYKFDHWSDESRKIPDWFKKEDEENIWYSDYMTGKLSMQKNIAGTNLSVVDSLRKFDWKITNDTRVIAGFNCRKAVTKIFDSVYVFAFYTDEIMISGGPCSINGLPGMILGVTIPRLFTSWIATKVSVNTVNEKDIVPVSDKKAYNLAVLKTTIIDHTKDWYSNDDPDENKEIEQQKARFIWLSML